MDSTIMMNKNGDNRSPCQITLLLGKYPIGVPFMSIEKETDEM